MSESREAPFEDFFELEHFFELLDEWAAAPDTARLDDLCHERSHIRRRVAAVLARVRTVEVKSGMRGRHSHQFDLLSDLDSLLSEIEYPSELNANISDLKTRLQSAQVIADQIRIEARDEQIETARPAVKQTAKALEGLQRSNLERYGDPDEKKIRFDTAIIQTLRDHPQWSPTQAKRAVARQQGVSYDTVKRNSSPADAFKNRGTL